MAYRIVYYRSEQEVGSTSHPGPLYVVQALAKESLRLFNAESYGILDLYVGSLVASGKRDEGKAPAPRT